MKKILLTLFLLLFLNIPIMAMEFVDEFPPVGEFPVFIEEKIIDKCIDGTEIKTLAYGFVTEPTLLYVEAYRTPDMEEPVTVIFIDALDEEITFDIYIKNMDRIEWYRNPSEFKRAYPEGLCGGSTL